MHRLQTRMKSVVNLIAKLPKRGAAFSITGVPAALRNRLTVLPVVQEALMLGQPVVALESTIITHGMPYPQNFNMAMEVESILRAGGVTPATIALVDGQAHVGLDECKIRLLAEERHRAVKVSRRDLAYVLSQRLLGGTTISATMLIAHMAGIEVFVSGGLGGVHRGGEVTMDVSADLTELGRTPLAVVCSGVKSILDIGRTLEYLETQGVLVASYGNQHDFPAFFTPKSGFKAPHRVKDAREAARVIDTSLSLGLRNGIVIAVPIPDEQSGPGSIIEAAIQAAVKEAEQRNVVGKDVTPFVLSRVNELSKGKSLDANLALVRNNAKVGADIARELASLRLSRSACEKDASPSTVPRDSIKMAVCSSAAAEPNWTTAASDELRPVVIGGTILDYMATIMDPNFQLNGATYCGSVQQSCGGVGRNIADGLTRLGSNPIFLSAIGDDLHSIFLRKMSPHMDWSMVKMGSGATATYDAFLRETGEVLFGIGDMDIHAEIDSAYIKKYEYQIAKAPFVCVDGNITTETMSYVLKMCKQFSVPVYFEPTDISKAVKPFLGGVPDCIAVTKPNYDELYHMYAVVTGRSTSCSSEKPDDIATVLQESSRMCCHLVQSIPLIIVTLGKKGVLVCRNLSSKQTFQLRELTGGNVVEATASYEARHYAALAPVERVLSVSGAGDSFGAAVLCGLQRGYTGDLCVQAALQAARLSLQSYSTISPRLDSSIFIVKNPGVVIG